MARISQTDLETIEKSRVALENATTNSQISQLLEEVGFGGTKLEEGKALSNQAFASYESNKTENVEASLAYDLFDAKKMELNTLYRKHRKRAKVIFRENPEFLIKLDIHKATPTVYLSWLDSVKVFYKVALGTEVILTSLQTLKVSAEELQSAQGLIGNVEQLRNGYLNEKGESQEATKVKDNALKQLDKWMRNFYAVASIALEDHPQLVESLGKVVKS